MIDRIAFVYEMTLEAWRRHAFRLWAIPFWFIKGFILSFGKGTIISYDPEEWKDEDKWFKGRG